MVKIVEHPTSTSHVLNFNFHYIKDAAEAENVKKIMGDKKPFIVGRTVDMKSFQPTLYFAIPENKPFIDWLKYAAPMEIMDLWPPE